jgi:hypothetical protein
LETDLEDGDNLQGDKDEVEESKIDQESWDHLLIEDDPMSDIEFNLN